jgi:hypothetical protein
LKLPLIDRLAKIRSVHELIVSLVCKKLEQRVRVLERIATDREGQDAATLAGQIEDLRTAPAN